MKNIENAASVVKKIEYNLKMETAIEEEFDKIKVGDQVTVTRQLRGGKPRVAITGLVIYKDGKLFVMERNGIKSSYTINDLIDRTIMMSENQEKESDVSLLEELLFG